MKTIYKAFITFNATSCMILIYLIKNKYWLCNYLNNKSILIYLFVLLLFTIICIKLRFVLKKSSIQGKIKEISIVTDGYVTVYLGYFFVALSVPDNDWVSFWSIFLLVYVFLFNSQTIYFNPLLLLFGYNFYEVYTEMGTRIYVISREQNVKGTIGLEFNNLRKINEFTYLDEEKANGLFIGKGKR